MRSTSITIQSLGRSSHAQSSSNLIRRHLLQPSIHVVSKWLMSPRSHPPLNPLKDENKTHKFSRAATRLESPVTSAVEEINGTKNTLRRKRKSINKMQFNSFDYINKLFVLLVIIYKIICCFFFFICCCFLYGCQQYLQ